AWLAFASSARLATRLPALRRVPLRSSRSPRALRRSSGSTPASITPALSICAASS
ncbi:hemagglutinin, partial [Pseudomonas aeruginosa]